MAMTWRSPATYETRRAASIFRAVPRSLGYGIPVMPLFSEGCARITPGLRATSRLAHLNAEELPAAGVTIL